MEQTQVKKRSWVESSFSQSGSSKMKLKAKTKPNNEDLWVEKYSPKTKNELAVHSKKISEIESWLVPFQDGKQKKSSILLLTGPAGVGKTASIYALAADMGFEVKEWINPLSRSISVNQPEQNFPYENQAKIFWDFVMKTCKYNSLELQGNFTKHHQIILVEDLPNVFMKNPEEFQYLLRKLHRLQRCPVVFILSDTKAGSQACYLFPSHLQQELFIQTISFNAVAPTIMMKVLQRIAAAELNPVPKKADLESLAELSSGDIRMAINSLQFSYSGLQNHRSKTIKTKKGSEKDKLPSSTKDVSYHIFRALGKVLHCKRTKEISPSEELLADHLKHFTRSPLVEKPEDIVHNSCLSSETLILFLHQNYLAFFSEIEDVVSATKNISDADLLISEWMSQQFLQECSALIAVRGLMHSNCSGRNSGWQPLYKPYHFTAHKMMRENWSTVQQLCSVHRLSAKELVTDVFPYKNLTRSPANSPDEAILMKDLCSFSRSHSFRSSEVLDKSEFIEDDNNEKDTVQIKADGYPNELNIVAQSECDDEIIIEDFDN